MEVSHRGRAFMAVAERAESDLRELLAIPANYRVLFMQGGATAAVLSRADESVGGGRDGRLCPYRPLVRARDQGGAPLRRRGRWSRTRPRRTIRRFPLPPRSRARPGAAYLHYTPNETIGGVEFPYVPDTGDVPLVADMSSTILSRPLDVSRFGLIYAGAQKNIGPSGITVVIVRDDLVRGSRPGTPMVFDYRAVADAGSMLNTPPTFAWYFAGLVFQWLKREGGVAAMGRGIAPRPRRCTPRSTRRPSTPIPSPGTCRSWMNVPFRLAKPGAGEDLPRGGRGRGPRATWQATARSAGCARASTTPCRWRACARSSSSCAISSGGTADAIPDPHAQCHLSKGPRAPAARPL